MSLLLKGILIGLLFGVPVGAVGAMTVQRTWEHGIKAGLLTGIGSSIADCIYAAIGAFGLTMVSDFLLEYQTANPGSVGKSADVSFFFCDRDYESGGDPDLSVCLFLVWHCGRKYV